MALSHDANTRFPTTENTVDTTTGDRTFSHTPTGSPDGVCVAICTQSTTAPVTGVLYGGVTMSLIVSATDSTEAGRVDIYVLAGVAVPDGVQTVTLQGATASAKFATCSTVTSSSTDRTAVNASNFANTTTAANPTIVLTTTDTTISYGAVHTGAGAPPVSAITGCTLQNQRDYGALSACTVRRTATSSAGSVSVGVTLASDDYCIAAIAFAEVANYPRVVMARRLV